jgi:hypothetical protein
MANWMARSGINSRNENRPGFPIALDTARGLENLYKGGSMICVCGYEAEKVSESECPGIDFPEYGITWAAVIDQFYRCPGCEREFHIWKPAEIGKHSD